MAAKSLLSTRFYFPCMAKLSLGFTVPKKYKSFGSELKQVLTLYDTKWRA
jgi:hypothetical protein